MASVWPLSSPATVFYKFVLPALLVLVATVICLRTLIEDIKTVPLVIFVSSLILLLEYWLYGRIKRISLDGSTLVISNFRKEVRIPLSDLEKASGSLGINPEVVSLYFRHATPLVRRYFLPLKKGGFQDSISILSLKCLT